MAVSIPTAPRTTTEVEVRGPMSSEEIAAIAPQLERMSLQKKQDRYIVCFFAKTLREKGVDLRARITDGKVEMVIKQGAFLGHARSEHVVPCADGSFMELIRSLAACGFTEVAGCHRVSTRYMDGDIEFALVEVPGHSFFYEVELLTDADGAKEAEERLHAWTQAHGLRTYTEEAFRAYVREQLDKEANDFLDLNDPASFDFLEKKVRHHVPAAGR